MKIEDQGLLSGRSIFVSASIPDPSRWTGEFDALGITDAVVAVARAVLACGGRLVTAAHPTIAPLLLYVAAEQPRSSEPPVVVYQSEVFATVLPEATRRFEAEGIGEVIRTPAIEGELPTPTHAVKSLELMRLRMLTNESPSAAVFIGGMEGIPLEYSLFKETRPGSPIYALGRPGGESASLVRESPAELHAVLAESAIYPTVARSIVQDIAMRLSHNA